jgi:hypothetical protein
MSEHKILPKSIDKNELESNKKRLFIEHVKPMNNIHVNPQFRIYNKRVIEHNNGNQEEPKKIVDKFFNINNIKTKNYFIKKNYDSLSNEKVQKNQILHQDNLKKLKNYEKLLDELEKKYISLSNDIDQLENEEDSLKNDLKTKEDEEKELNTELENIKNLNDEKNRELLHLMNTNIQQQNERLNNNNNNNNNSVNNNSQPNNNSNNHQENHISINDLLNRVLAMQRSDYEENNEEGENNNIMQQSINNSIIDDNGEYGKDLGPPMPFEQIDSLPVEKYPKKDTYEEKCVLCKFNFCYNDSITKLAQCQHIFHKECLGNFLIRKQGSKCPICKVSLI